LIPRSSTAGRAEAFRFSAHVNTTARLVFVGCVIAVVAVGFLPVRLRVLQAVPWREAEHSAAFFALTCGAAFSFPKVRLTHIVLVGVALGAAMELAQATSWIGRHGAFSDWIADALGSVLVLMVSGMTLFRQSQTPVRRPLGQRAIPDRRARLARLDRPPGR
jgi:hypothetical protein